MTPHPARDAIAIIGMACRMPGARDAAEFWRNLREGVQSFTTFTEEELLRSGVDAAQLASPHYVRTRGVIGGADEFDAEFFGFTPREAELLDPQQRIFLECAWLALEDAGYGDGESDNRVGVFGGVGTNWHLSQAAQSPVVKKFASGASIVIGNDKDYVTTRVSYRLGLTGPSVNVQTACSTSLVATILGMMSLRTHQCDMALAGGATIELPEAKGYLHQEGGMESADGRCRPFDAGANGTVFSRGSGVVVLKRLEDALRDRDHVYAVIRDGAINNDGSAKVGFTAPSVAGQVELVIEALERAELSAADMSFVEAHGTATPLGDPIEVEALTQAFRHYTDETQFCALGSVKGNIGHTDVASGIAGLIKASHAIEKRLLPASLNFTAPNPKIDFTSGPLFINTDLRPLGTSGTPVRALVSSFGVGGTNACVVLEQAPLTPAATRFPVPNVVVLSARSDAALTAQIARLRAHVAAEPNLDLDRMAFTLQAGRKRFPVRRFLPFSDRDDLLAALASPPPADHAVCQKEGGPVALMFPGQGNQFAGMGRGVYRAHRTFREAVDRACAHLMPLLDVDLRDILFAEGLAADGAQERLKQTSLAQPALFVIGYAQAVLWRSWGIEPEAMIGHSVGEYVAACLAGVFSFEDALTLIAARGRLIQDLPAGSMLAVLLPERDVIDRLPAGVEIAAVNSRQLVVVAGPQDAIARFEERLSREKVVSRHLRTSHAFHSAMMDPAVEAFAAIVRRVALKPPAIPIVSTLTGTWLTDDEATDAGYWARHMRAPVRFADAFDMLADAVEACIFLECGPGHSLASAGKSLLDRGQHHRVLSSLPAEPTADGGTKALMRAVGGLWAGGRPIRWDVMYGDGLPGRTPLPGYAFERKRFALDLTSIEAAAQPKRDMRQANVGDWFYAPSWTRTNGPSFLVKGAAEAGPRSWLLFDDGSELGTEMVRSLRWAGHDVARVLAGDAFAVVGDDITLRPDAREDYDDLIATLKERGRRPTRMVHLWNVGGSADDAAAVSKLAFTSPLLLEQALIAQGLNETVRLLIVTSGVVSVAGEAVTAPLRALAAGPARVIAKEFPMLQSRMIDVAPHPDLAMSLVREAELDLDDTLVVYRGGHRFAEHYEPLHLGPAAGIAGAIRDGGTYLITGGLGALGLFFAQAFAASARVNLVLVHRSAFPSRERWGHQTSWPDADTGSRIAALQAIEASGVTIMLAQADVADGAAMRRVVDEAEHRFGRIDGVVHSAGAAGGGIIALKTPDMAAQVLRPKVDGTLVIEGLFRDRAIDFILLFSSVTAVLGEAGRVDYCAANSVMDAVAQRWAQVRPGIMRSIGWAAWAEIGMASRWEDAKARRQGSVGLLKRAAPGEWLHPISSETGLEVFEIAIDPAADWIVTDHKVFGVPALVGTSFIEFVCRYAALRDPDRTAEISNLYFVAPLMMPSDAPRRLRLTVKRTGDRGRFSFKSQAAADPAGDWQEHCVGDLAIVTPSAGERHDIERMRSEFVAFDESPRSDLDSLAEDGRPLLTFGQRWRTLTEIDSRPGAWLSSLHLSPEFASDLDEFLAHPALIDVALASGRFQIALAAARDGTPDGHYLPLAYRKLRLFKRIPTQVWSYAVLRGEHRASSQTITFDVLLMDSDGDVCLSVEGYMLKKVDSTLPTPTASASPRRAGLPPAADADIRRDEGLDALQRILGHASLPHLVVTTKDLTWQIEDGSPSVKARAVRAQIASGGEASPSRGGLRSSYEEPENEIEKAIAEIWQGILGIAQIGACDDFVELGGNSLLAVQMVTITSETFQIDLSVDVFFRAPTIRSLAAAVIDHLIALADPAELDKLVSGLEG